MSQPNRSARPEEPAIAVPIVWEGTLEAPLIFSNSFVVQHTEHEFIITFAQVQPPILFPGDEARARQIDSVKARVAVRIALPPSRAEELIRILTENFQSYLQRMRSLEPPTQTERGQ